MHGSGVLVTGYGIDALGLVVQSLLVYSYVPKRIHCHRYRMPDCAWLTYTFGRSYLRVYNRSHWIKNSRQSQVWAQSAHGR